MDTEDLYEAIRNVFTKNKMCPSGYDDYKDELNDAKLKFATAFDHWLGHGLNNNQLACFCVFIKRFIEN